MVRPWNTRAPFQYTIRRLIVRYHEVSKQRKWEFELYRFEICGAYRQHYTCQISGRSHNSRYKSCGFEMLPDHTIRCRIGYWNGAPHSRGHAAGHLISLLIVRMILMTPITFLCWILPYFVLRCFPVFHVSYMVSFFVGFRSFVVLGKQRDKPCFLCFHFHWYLYAVESCTWSLPIYQEDAFISWVMQKTIFNQRYSNVSF